MYLIEADVFCETTRPDGIEQAKRSKTVNIALQRDTSRKAWSALALGEEERREDAGHTVYSAMSKETLT